MSILTINNHKITVSGHKIGFIQSSLISGLVSYYTLNETSGNAIDSKGIQNALVNAYRNPSGKLGYCVDVSYGTSVGIPYNVNSKINWNTFSVSYWINWHMLSSSIGHDAYMFASNHNADPWTNILARSEWNGGAGYTNNVQVITYDASKNVYNAVNNTLFTINTWYFVTIVFKGSGYATKIYLNGVDDTNVGEGTTFNGILFQATDNTYVGNSITSGTSNFANAKFDEVGIWNRALTPTEVSTLYNNGIGKTYPFS